MYSSASNRYVSICALLLVCCSLALSVAWASKVRPVNLEEMTVHAATIFSGRCVDVRIEEDPGVGTVTLATFQVHRAVKGNPGETVTVRLLANQPPGVARQPAPAGATEFTKNEEVILFLYPESPLGLTSPVGLGQGKFSVHTDKAGRRFAVNLFGNDSLFDGLSTRARERLTPMLTSLGGAETLDSETLLDLAGSLVD